MSVSINENISTNSISDQEANAILLLLVAFLEAEERKWDELRSLKEDSNPSKEEQYKYYFDKVFEKGVPFYQLKKGTMLYRARHIKSKDEAELGVDLSKLMDSFCKSFLNEDDIRNMDSMNDTYKDEYYISPEIMLALKLNKENMENYESKVDEFVGKYKGKGVYGFKEKGIRVPPLDNRRPGRFNLKEDEFLYLALDRETAIYEMRPSINQLYCIGEFISNKTLRLVDMRGDYTKQEVNTALNTIARKVSETNTDNEEYFYSITQYMSHLLLEKKYDGIIYKSSIKKDGINVMLFNEADVDFLSSEIVQINETKVEFSNVLPFDGE